MNPIELLDMDTSAEANAARLTRLGLKETQKRHKEGSALWAVYQDAIEVLIRLEVALRATEDDVTYG
jgi:hypothetical protein